MDALPLPVIGWLYTIVSSAALLLGAYIVAGLHLQGEGERRQLLERVVEDAVLFGIWILGLAGGVGVLLAKPWSRSLLEFFCWVIAALTLFSAYTRLRAPGAVRRGTLALSVALFVLPVLAICGATICTLRGEEAVRVLGGGSR
jgi:hypothetical protein